ncbi:MAG TPA: acyl-CoA synthetase [Alphaproteobacteria bacterium]|nr:acyl-CoA synthetase [Alphaproteobacteria bacterium]
MTPEQKANLKRLFQPRHVAVIGGSDAVTVATECARIGYEGPFWPVNPKRQTIGGHRCYAAVEDLPEPPDACFIAVPIDAAIDSMAKLNAMGAGGAVIYTAGFGEIGDDGAKKEARLIKAAGDMAVIGPNCYGLINYVDKVALWPFAHGGSFPGYGAAVITQSGMLSSDLTMSMRSLPLAYMLSIGNQAIMRIEDCINSLVDRPEVRAIGIHIEGLKDPNAFAAAAMKALAADKPIVVLKTGTSAIGAELTVSHTGSLSGTDDVYQALFDRLGIIRAKEPGDFLEILKYLTITARPNGYQVTGFTCSGGGATMLADYGEELGLEYPRPDNRKQSGLKPLLPHTATVSNPLDYTTPIWGMPEKTEPVFDLMLKSETDMAVLIQDYPAPGLDESRCYYYNDAMAFVRATKRYGIPAAVCSTIAENLDQEIRDELIAEGVAPMQGIGDCMKAMSASAQYAKARADLLASPPLELMLDGHDLSASSIMLDEHDSKSLLAKAGLDIPRALLISDLANIAASPMPADIRFPLVAKAVSPDMPHKTELGAVKLGLTDWPAVILACQDIQKNCAQLAPHARLDAIMVEEYVADSIAELMISLRRDAQFGCILTIASGGILVELIKDAKTLIMPSDKSQLADALDQLATAKLIHGYRGKAGGDMSAVIQVIETLTDLMAHHHDIHMIEINPLMITATSVMIADAVIHRHS